MKKLAIIGALAPVAAFAEGTGTSQLPASFNTAVADLQATGEAAASSLTPMVTAIAVAFVLVGLVLVAVRWFRRSAK